MSAQINNKNYALIEQFTRYALNKKFKSMLELKKAHKLCRIFIEKALAGDSNLQAILPQSTEHRVLMQELIVNYTLLQMQHHTTLWEINSYKPNLTLGWN